MIRLLAPCPRFARTFLSWPGARCAFGWSTLSIDACFVVLRLTSSRTTPFPVSAARSRAPLVFPFSAARSRCSSCLLLRRLAAPPVFSFLCPPREGWAERREAHQLVRSRLRSATTVLARHGTVPATGTAPVDAPS